MGFLGSNDSSTTPGTPAPSLRVTTMAGGGGKRYIGQLIGIKKKERSKQSFQKKDFLKK